ncbi:MAG TPA: DUF6600 domain-containing protein [Candidatus Methylacidiphilales bacterium]|nr:DUF6600 domain-containing protein [Candidatus Methylacidiphilales bacterium]
MTDKRLGFPWKFFLMLTACAFALSVAPLRAQDVNAVAPPPSDNGATGPVPDVSGGAPDTGITFQTFYDALSPLGAWIQSADYGYVWQPQVNDPNWAPYTDGYWVNTADGWIWVSNEPWGWATYHYGRWVNLDGIGWCWVPGYTWAPAWVSWRYGDGYAGWAPLPPDSFVGIDYSDDSDNSADFDTGFHIGGDCDGFYGIGPAWYIFLPVNYFGYRNYHGHYCNRNDNYAIINHTTNVTNINVTGNSTRPAGAARFRRVTTGGPALAQVNAVSQTPVPTVSLVRANRPGGGGLLTGDSLELYAPRVAPAANAQPTRVAGSVIRQATINHGTDITRPLAVNANLAPAPATEAQIEQARIARHNAPADAKVVTDGNSIQPILHAPLTSMTPKTPSPSSTFNTAPTTIYNTGRGPSTSGVPGVPPTARTTYPQTGEEGTPPSRVYTPGAVYPSTPPTFQPHPTAPTPTGGGYAPRPEAQPAAPANTPPPAADTHPSSGGGSTGGGTGSHTSGTTSGSSQQSH